MIVLMTIFVILALESVAARDVYVDGSASGKQDGSKANPYHTIQNGINNTSAGEVIFIEEGVYYETLSMESNQSIRLFGQGDVVVHADNKEGEAGLLVSVNHLLFENMTFRNASSDMAGVFIDTSSWNITFTNCIIWNASGDGIYIDSGSRSIYFNDCQIKGNAGDGLVAPGGIYNIYFENTVFKKNTGTGATIDESDRVYFESCNFSDNGGGGFYTNYGDIWFFNSSISEDEANDITVQGFEEDPGYVWFVDGTFNGESVSISADAYLYDMYYIHTRVRKGSGSGMEEVDVEYLDGEEQIYASKGFNGSDDQTDEDGYVEWVPVTHKYYDQFTSGAENETTINVKYRSWSDSREIDNSNTHTEIFNYTGQTNIYVDDDAAPGGDGSLEHPFDNIQDGVDAANESEVVRIFAGWYNGSIWINESIELLGNGSSEVFVVADGSNPAFRVQEHDVVIEGLMANSTGTAISITTWDSLLLKNLTVGNYGTQGIRLYMSDRSTLWNVTVKGGNGHGVVNDESDYVTYLESTVVDAKETGITISDSVWCTLTNTTVNGSETGLYIEWSNYTYLYGFEGVYNSMSGISLDHTRYTRMYDGTYLTENEENGLFGSYANYTYVYDSMFVDNTYAGINLTDSYYLYTNNLTLSDNGQNGLKAVDQNYIYMYYATIMDVSGDMIRLVRSENVTLYHSDIEYGNMQADLTESFINFYNGTLNPNGLDLDVNSYIRWRNRLDIHVMTNTSGNVSGADLEVRVDNVTYYASEGYDGPNPQTGEDGRMGWRYFEVAYFNGSASEDDLTDIWLNVSYTPSEELAWNETRQIALNVSHVENFTYIKPAVNRKAWTYTWHPEDEVSRSGGAIDITVTVYDKEGDTCSIAVQYSMNGGLNFTNATLEGEESNIIENLASDRNGTNHTVSWDSESDMPTNDSREVIIRIIASDGKEGYTNDSEEFHVDNDLNAPDIFVYTMNETEYADTIEFIYNLSDQEEMASRIYVEYKDEEGNWTACTVDGGASDPRTNIDTTTTGENFTFAWRSHVDLSGVDKDDVKVRFRANDGGDDNDNSTDEIVTIHVDNNEVPAAKLDNIFEGSGYIEVEFELRDDESDNCTVILLYSIDDKQNWSVATINETGQEFPSSPSGNDSSIWWDSVDDIEGWDADVDIKLIPVDNDNGTGFGSGNTDSLRVDNDFNPPDISATNPSGDLFKSVWIDITVTDDEDAEASVEVYYTVNDGPELLADIESENHSVQGSEIVDIVTTGGADVQFKWDILADFGKSYFENVTLVLYAADGVDVEDKSEPYNITDLVIDNTPYLTKIEITDMDWDKKNLTVTFELTDWDEAKADIELEYSLDGGTTWHDDLKILKGTEDPEKLATSKDGEEHSFTWDTWANFKHNITTEAMLRLTPDVFGETADPVESEEFTIDNILNIAPEIEITDIDLTYNDITVSFTVADVDSAKANITLYYLNPGKKTATIWGNTENLNSSSGKDYEIVWLSVTDLGYNSQEIDLQIKAHDGENGNLSDLYNFDIENGDMPSIDIDSSSTKQVLNKGMVEIQYDLIQESSKKCDLTFEYTEDEVNTSDPDSIDSAIWDSMTESDNINSEGDEDLSSGSGSGTFHRYFWDILTDLGEVDMNVTIRMKADTGTHESLWFFEPVSIDSLGMINLEPTDISFTPVIGTIDAGTDVTFEVEIEDDEIDDIKIILYWRLQEETKFSKLSLKTNDTGDFGTFSVILDGEFVVKPGIEYYLEIEDGEYEYRIPENDTDSFDVKGGGGGGDGGGDSSEDKEGIMGIPTEVFIGVIGMVVLMIAVVVGLKKRGGKPKRADEPAPGATPAPAPAAPAAPAAPTAAPAAQPAAGAQMANCPVCQAPIAIPPQRPVTVKCASCGNGFAVK